MHEKNISNRLVVNGDEGSVQDDGTKCDSYKTNDGVNKNYHSSTMFSFGSYVGNGN